MPFDAKEGDRVWTEEDGGRVMDGHPIKSVACPLHARNISEYNQVRIIEKSSIIPIIKVECHRTLTNIDCQSLIYEEDSVGLTGPRGGAVPA